MAFSKPDPDAQSRPARTPVRTCVGCGRESEPQDFLRFVLGPDAQVVVDLSSRLGGRGAWVHARPECLKAACDRGFARSFKAAVHTNLATLGEQLQAACVKRLDGLLLAAARRGSAVHGREAVKEVAAAAAVVLLAEDAKSVARDSTLQALGQQGKIVVFGDKDHYGRLFGKMEVGVLALLEAGIAEAVTHTISLARLGTHARHGGGDPQQLGAHKLSEVR